MFGIGRELQRYPYRHGWRSVAFARGLVVLFIAGARLGYLEGDWFVMLGCLGLAITSTLVSVSVARQRARPQRVVVGTEGLRIPHARRGEIDIRLEELVGVKADGVPGRRVLHLDAHGGRHSIFESMLPSSDVFEAIRWFVETGRWDWDRV